MNLIGLDVGFSASRRSSGVACLHDGRLRKGRATADWPSRAEILGALDEAAVAAIDAPVVPALHARPRVCERIFTFGQFQRRCKPGLSHVRGTGQELRSAGFETAGQLSPLVEGESRSRFPKIWPGANIVEAFPNAFLGVILPDSTFASRPRLRRGQKFDWLYEECLQGETIFHLARSIDARDDLGRELEECTDHDERAALICLLTAGGVARQRYTAVGDRDDGYFFLPSLEYWSEWARQELEKQAARFEQIEIWVDGERVDSWS